MIDKDININIKILLSLLILHSVTTTTTTTQATNMAMVQQLFNDPKINLQIQKGTNITKCSLKSGNNIILFLTMRRELYAHTNPLHLLLTNDEQKTLSGKLCSVTNDTDARYISVGYSTPITIYNDDQRKSNFTLSVINKENNSTLWRSTSKIRPIDFLLYCFPERNVNLTEKRRTATSLTLHWKIEYGLKEFNPRFFVLVDKKQNTKTNDYFYTVTGLEKCKTYDVCIKVKYRMNKVKYNSSYYCFTSKSQHSECNVTQPTEVPPGSNENDTMELFALAVSITLVLSLVVVSIRYRQQLAKQIKTCANAFKAKSTTNDEILEPRLQHRGTINNPTEEVDQSPIYEEIPSEVYEHILTYVSRRDTEDQPFVVANECSESFDNDGTYQEESGYVM